MESIPDTAWVIKNQRLDGLETKDKTKNTTVPERMEYISTRPSKSIEQSSNELTETDAALTWPTQICGIYSVILLLRNINEA